MTTSPLPRFLLCCRCCSAALADTEAASNWHQLTMPLGTTLDICPNCAAVLLKVLRQTPDILEDGPWR